MKMGKDAEAGKPLDKKALQEIKVRISSTGCSSIRVAIFSTSLATFDLVCRGSASQTPCTGKPAVGFGPDSSKRSPGCPALSFLAFRFFGQHAILKYVYQRLTFAL